MKGVEEEIEVVKGSMVEGVMNDATVDKISVRQCDSWSFKRLAWDDRCMLGRVLPLHLH